MILSLVYPLAFGTWEIIAIVAVIILLFGGRKIPELMQGIGKGVKSFKKGMNEVEKEMNEITSDIDSSAKSPDKIEKKNEYSK
jgi:sec-independent protein translocase protein TatA